MYAGIVVWCMLFNAAILWKKMQINNMFLRKLSALGYPQSDSTNTIDKKEFRRIIAWLEERKIKKYKPKLQKNIRNISSPDWQKSFDKYKQEVACPVASNKFAEELDWFIIYALKLEYSNKRSTYEILAADIESANTRNLVVFVENPLDRLDFCSKDFENGIKAIAGMLKISPHPNPLITLKAISKMTCSRLNRFALAQPNDFSIKGTPFPSQDAGVGFDLGDAVLNRAAKILRLIYIHNLRDLQTQVNELVASVQSITANPKADTKLGKVGK